MKVTGPGGAPPAGAADAAAGPGQAAGVEPPAQAGGAPPVAGAPEAQAAHAVEGLSAAQLDGTAAVAPAEAAAIEDLKAALGSGGVGRAEAVARFCERIVEIRCSSLSGGARAAAAEAVAALLAADPAFARRIDRLLGASGG